jgi:hypothetical protein
MATESNVQVTAKSEFRHGSQDVKSGDTLTVTREEAEQLRKQGLVEGGDTGGTSGAQSGATSQQTDTTRSLSTDSKSTDSKSAGGAPYNKGTTEA